MFSFDKNINVRDKVLTITTYILLCNFPLGVVFMVLFNDGVYPKMHFNRAFFCGFLYLFNFLAIQLNVPVNLEFINLFVGIISIIGMVQALFGEKTSWFWFDRLSFTPHEGKMINKLIQIAITIIVLTLSVIF